MRPPRALQTQGDDHGRPLAALITAGALMVVAGAVAAAIPAIVEGAVLAITATAAAVVPIVGTWGAIMVLVGSILAFVGLIAFVDTD